MAAGFRTPLFILGLSVAVQAGFHGPLPHRGISGEPSGQAGFQNPLPVWRGGVASQAGFQNPLPIWMGGGTPGVTPEVVVTTRSKDTRSKSITRDRLIREDEEILSVIMAYMMYR